MDFLSVKFLIFLVVTATLNYVLPNTIRLPMLLIASFIFYYVGAEEFFYLLIVLCLITYLFGNIIDKFRKRIIYFLGVCCILVSLVYFKYAEFIVEMINRLTSNAVEVQMGVIIAPLGISFMTFQAISYLSDIYYGKIRAEKSPITVALYVSFFPNVTSGPIQKAKNFIPILKNRAVFKYEKIKHGILLATFGGLQKYYISDKLAPMVATMQTDLLNESIHSGFHYIFFASLYAIYLYSNFNSYSDMAIGIAEILGFDFSENFRRPYFSQSIKEFWQRWHISLNSWFVDYVYIPLGGSRKGKFRYYINILIVFFLSGLWHGASLHFIAWGLLNAFYQIFGSLTKKFRNKLYGFLKIDQTSAIIVVWKRLCVFYLISISWIFFTIPSTRLAMKMSWSMIFPSVMGLFDGWIISQFDSVFSAINLLSTIIILVLISLIREKSSMMNIINKQAPIIRYAIYILILVLLMIGFFGTFTGAGNGGFVYGNF